MTACRCPACSPDPLPTFTEAHRFACELRHLIAMPTGNDRSRYLAGVREKRGDAARAALVKALSDWHSQQSGELFGEAA